MEAFIPEITAFLRKKQYETELFEQDIVLQPTDIVVRQGQQIGLMGNRGASRGQHVHFEIRETKTEVAVNPLLFGFNVPDNVPPRLEDLKVYLMDDKKDVIAKKSYSAKRKSMGVYKIEYDTVDVAAPYVGFAIQATDIQSGNSGENGIYTLELKVNDTVVYQYKADRVGFDETRYLNAHIDYSEQYNRNNFFHRTFRLPGNQLGMYAFLQNDGIIPLPMPSEQVSMTDFVSKKISSVAVVGRFFTLSGIAVFLIQVIRDLRYQPSV